MSTARARRRSNTVRTADRDQNKMKAAAIDRFGPRRFSNSVRFRFQSPDADAVIDLEIKNAAERLRGLAPGGLDAAFVLAGGENLESLLDVIRPGGRVAYPNGVEPTPRRRTKVRMISYDGIVSPKHFSRLNRVVEEARLQVPLAVVYPLTQAARAHERLKRGHVLGRIALRIRR